MDDSVPAIVQDDSLDNNKNMNDPNATMDINNGQYTVIDNEDDDDQENIQDPIVITWFTFYSHREQREYYYEPVSGTTTWIAPSLTICDTNEHNNDDKATDDTENQPHSSSTAIFKNIISRLPGSPMFQESVRQHVQNAITVSNRIHQNQIVPIITKRHIAILLLMCNIVLFNVWFRWGSGGDDQVVVLNTTKVTEAPAIGNISIIAVNATNTIQPITQSGDDNAGNDSPSESLHLPQVDEIYPHDEAISTTETIYDNEIFDAVVDSSTKNLALDVFPDDDLDMHGRDVYDAVETIYDKIELPINPSPSILESILNSDESPNSTIEDVRMQPEDPQDTIVELDDKAVDTKAQNKVVTAGTSHATKITSSVVSEPDRNLNLPDVFEPNGMMIVEAEELGSLPASEEDFTILAKNVEEPVDTENYTVSDNITEDDGIAADERNNTLSISNDELEAIQKEALMVVQRVGMTAINAGYMIELEPNFTTSNNSAEDSRTLMADLLTNNHTWV